MLRSPFSPPLDDRPSAFPWLLLGVMVVVDACWLAWSPIALDWQGVGISQLMCLCLLAPLALRRYRQDERLSTLLPGLALLLAFFNITAVLSYLVITTDAPLMDAQFAAADRWLGFDWPGYYRWVRSNPPIDRALHWAYISAMSQLLFIVIYLASRRRRADLAEFLQLLVWTALITVLVSGPWPAAGAWQHYQINLAEYANAQSHFALLRSGDMALISLTDTQGLVSLPSFHASLGVLFCLALRHSRLFWAALPLNLLMIASTPVMGGHYLVDVLAGIVLPFSLLGLAGLRPRLVRRSQAATGLAEPAAGDAT